ncbi:MAG: lasso peptide biosynthesis B2 protein [Gemmatimonadales bacterium]
MITLMKLMLRLRGFSGTIAWIRQRVDSVPLSGSPDLETIRRVEYAVAMAGALYPARAMCLEQSFTLYYLLRREGVAVRYCQGVTPHPFEAHAWVEHRGEPINDVAEHVRLFVRLPDMLP